MPLAIDELPLVALLGCFAEGRTVVSGAGELRHKESDRIAAVVEGLRGIGAEIEAPEDGFAVRGTGGLRGGTLDARGDHRMAMLGAVAGLASREGVEVRRHGGGRGQLPAASRRTCARCSTARLAQARVALAGPGREQQQQAGVLGRPDLAALVGVEHGEQARRRRWRSRRRAR